MENKIVKNYCSGCNRSTNHKVLYSTTQRSKSNEDISWCEDFMTVQCCGCDEISFRREYEDESTIGCDEYGEAQIIPEIYTYPYMQGRVKYVDYWHYLPIEIYGIYKETINTLNNQSYRLAAAGFRALVEAICVNKKITGKNLDNKINNLHKSGYITKNDRDRLHAIRFMGNDSIHEMKEPTKNNLLLVLSIIHGLLNNLYIIDVTCKGKLMIPISEFSEFEVFLDEGLKKHSVGEIVILKGVLLNNQRLIKDDISKFEKELIEKIKSGEYTKLSLCPPPIAPNTKQQYKIEII